MTYIITRRDKCSQCDGTGRFYQYDPEMDAPCMFCTDGYLDTCVDLLEVLGGLRWDEPVGDGLVREAKFRNLRVEE